MEGKLTLWVVLVLIRIWWSMVPQSGYIHPDEFFQTVEVVAGNFIYITTLAHAHQDGECNSTAPDKRGYSDNSFLISS